MRKLLFSIVIVFLFYSVTAQIIVEQIEPSSIGSTLQIYLENAPVIEMPEFDSKWIEEEEKKVDVRNIIPPRFGWAYKTDISITNEGKWTQKGNVSIWTLTIESKGALSINLIFDEFFLSVGSEFNIYNDTKTLRFGPVSPKHNKLSRKLATDIIKGSSVTLVLTEPSTLENMKSFISVKYVVHGFATFCSFGDATLNCHINASCSQANELADEKYAVARILVNNGQSCCSGSLINNTCNDLTPYFLTAFHCVDFDEDRILDSGEEDDIETWLFSYRYISPNCTPSSEPSSWVTYSGADFKAYNNETDFLLVKMEDQPTSSTGLTYTGWSRYDNFPFQNEGTTGLHHPGGDVMKFSSDNSEPVENENDVRFYYNYPNSYFTMNEGTLWEVEFDNGAYEWGSSGSPLFDPNNRIIGQLVGGSVQCPPEPGFYGRISESWARSQNNDEQLAHWLDPNDTGAMTTNTIGIPYITGPSVVCTSNSTFTLHNCPPGTSIGWKESRNLDYVSGGNNNYTVKAYSNDSRTRGWVRVTITSSCDTIALQKNVWVGRPGTPVTTPDGDPPMEVVYGSSFLVNIFNPPGADPTTGEWAAMGSIVPTTGTSGKSWCHFKATSFGYGQWHVYTSNDCGNSDTYIGSVIVPWWKFGMSPNPADDYVEITAEKKEYDTKGVVSDNYEVKIFNNLKSVVYESAKTNQTSLWISTKQFITGTYYIHFTAGKQTEVKQLIIIH